MNSVEITTVTINSKEYLQFDFTGFLDVAVATDALHRWDEQMKKANNHAKVSLVYNCQNMKGFDTSARKLWQAAMQRHKNLVNTTWIISDNVFILGAAKTMGLLTGFPIKVTKNLQGIKD
ncbi:MAG: hypothetical protein JSS79_19945 [Bacteroidetes bacterium]|nr:hypothetical protein [Bacteroidota bacterium]